MNLYNDYKLMHQKTSDQGTIVTIGNFDGLHLGHRTIINKCIDLSIKEHLGFALCTFEPHPAEFFFNDRAKLRLLTPESKYRMMQKMGVETVLAQHFVSRFAAIEPEDFITEVLINALRAKIVVVGADFKFGIKRSGDINLLKKMGLKLGFKVIGEELLQDENSSISSSRIRRLLLDGQTEHAAKLLGRFHMVPGRVIHGFKAGRKMGFPTINLDTRNVLIPGDGIYAAFCELEDSSFINAAVYTGERPTSGRGKSLEAHLLNFNRDIYGTDVKIHFVKKIRGDLTFSDTGELKKQIAMDIKTITDILENTDEQQ